MGGSSHLAQAMLAQDRAGKSRECELPRQYSTWSSRGTVAQSHSVDSTLVHKLALSNLDMPNDVRQSLASVKQGHGDADKCEPNMEGLIPMSAWEGMKEKSSMYEVLLLRDPAKAGAPSQKLGLLLDYKDSCHA